MLKSVTCVVLLCTVLSNNANAEPIMPKQFEGTASLIAFWRSDCAPCMVETKLLPEIATQHPALHIEIISLEKKSDTNSLLFSKMPANVHLTYAEGDTETTFKNFDDTKHALPYSVFLYDDGSVCKTHYGILGTDLVSQWMATC